MEWTTPLITGLRQGGSGYLALDFTDPGAAIAGPHGPYPKLLFEFDDPNEPLGDSWSEPIITRLKVRAPAGYNDHCGPDDGDGNCREQWVMIVGGGFLASGDPNLGAYLSDPNDPSWVDDSKSVFIVALDSGQVLAKLEHDASDPVFQDMTFAFPSTPAVLDMDFDGFADLVYIGDLGGQLWKWDLSAIGEDLDSDGLIDASSWPAGVYFRSAPVDVGGGVLHYRSIFFPPSAALVEGELTLSFGTGERTDLDYLGVPLKDENNRFHVIQDHIPTGPGSIPAAAYTEADITNITGLLNDPDLTDLGFYLIAEDGEKFVTNQITFSGFAITTTYLPDDSGAICASLGTAFVYIFDLEGGDGLFDPSDPGSASGRRLTAGVGVPSDPQISVSGGSSKVFIQTSTGSILTLDGPDPGDDAYSMVYWKQDL